MPAPPANPSPGGRQHSTNAPLFPPWPARGASWACGTSCPPAWESGEGEKRDGCAEKKSGGRGLQQGRGARPPFLKRFRGGPKHLKASGPCRGFTLPWRLHIQGVAATFSAVAAAAFPPCCCLPQGPGDQGCSHHRPPSWEPRGRWRAGGGRGGLLPAHIVLKAPPCWVVVSGMRGCCPFSPEGVAGQGVEQAGAGGTAALLRCQGWAQVERAGEAAAVGGGREQWQEGPWGLLHPPLSQEMATQRSHSSCLVLGPRGGCRRPTKGP